MSRVSLLALLVACDSSGPEVLVNVRLFDAQDLEVTTGRLLIDDPVLPGVRTAGAYAVTTGGPMPNGRFEVEPIAYEYR